MISAIVTSPKDERGLAATLSSLTAAAIDGLVREVIVAGDGASSNALAVAEDTGARVVDGPLETMRSVARQPWLLILPAGVRLQMGWEPAARGHIKRHPEATGWFLLNYAADGPGARIGEAWANGLARLGQLRAEHGLLVPARLWRASPRRLRAIKARILVGGDLAD